MFGETTISYAKIGNHPIETTIYKWLLGVPGWSRLGSCFGVGVCVPSSSHLGVGNLGVEAKAIRCTHSKPGENSAGGHCPVRPERVTCEAFWVVRCGSLSECWLNKEWCWDDGKRMDSAPKSPAASSVSASSMIKLSRSSSTLRTLRSIGSWQGCFSRSLAFNSRTVAVITTSRVMTFPCKVFNWTWQDMGVKGQLTVRTWPKNCSVYRVVLWVLKTCEPSTASLFRTVFTLAPATVCQRKIEIYDFVRILFIYIYMLLI